MSTILKIIRHECMYGGVDDISARVGPEGGNRHDVPFADAHRCRVPDNAWLVTIFHLDGSRTEHAIPLEAGVPARVMADRVATFIETHYAADLHQRRAA